jgi:hypothetical protein
MRAAVAALVAEQRHRGATPEQVGRALRECIEEYAPRRLALDDRAALTQLIVRWAIDAHEAAR